ncbi:inositol monophosphatase family protein [Arthrobacter sp.]|uniref:inositol monophosphatase family protein n=1 Tax=Arthrobacter sp. TaxID=1667 RepID=UPI003A8CA511
MSHNTAATPDLTAELLATARRAAAAGAAVLAQRQGVHIEADTKSAAGDWVTDYDRRAEQAVREVITAERPRDAITGEEYGNTTPADASPYRWSIDPLDGTANFVRGILYYATSVAVAGPAPEGTGEQVWLAGVVQAPALASTWWASRGAGAWLGGTDAGDDAGARRLTGPVPGAAGALVATGFGYDAERRDFQVQALAALMSGFANVRPTGRAPGAGGALVAPGFGYHAERRAFQVQALAALMSGFANVRRIGSAALDLCLVADGTLDAYAEYGTGEHDWSAGALIAEEAGCPVLRPDTDPGWQAAGYVDFEKLPAPPAG